MSYKALKTNCSYGIEFHIVYIKHGHFGTSSIPLSVILVCSSYLLTILLAAPYLQ
jgi:hypothetical protein